MFSVPAGADALPALQLPDPGTGSPQLAVLETRYVADRFADDPTAATNAGFHAYDDRLPDLSAAGYAHRVADSKQQLRDLAALDAAALSADDRADAAIMRAALETELVTDETQELWRHNPGRYTSTASSAIYAIFSRAFAPLPDRMRAAIARERAIPALLDAGRANTSTVDPVTAQLALNNMRGAVAFFRTTVPAAFGGVADAALQADFKQANDAAVAALEAYVAGMQAGPLAHPSGTYAIGPAVFAKRLELQEGRPITLEQYEKVGVAALAATKAEFVATAKKIDPSKSPAEVYEALGRDHPSPDNLLATAQGDLGALRAFVETHHLVTLPAENDVHVVETPTFDRQTTLAAMNTPGAFEKVATQAYYYVTPVEPSWADAQKSEHLAFYNSYAFPIISAHEVMPGHYVNFVLHKTEKLSLVRALAGNPSYTEGWAHYCEQMMVDEGLGNGDPKTRLAQLGLALQREARYLVGLREHTQGMTVDEGTTFFVDN
ncbi:MAG TPA: DUF885 domain-containing protein, partial [Candidatus Elarobacter sp.]|nr:DUF885 domain-containing protein [Candidatus Elarobacter sp.]